MQANIKTFLCCGQNHLCKVPSLEYQLGKIKYVSLSGTAIQQISTSKQNSIKIYSEIGKIIGAPVFTVSWPCGLEGQGHSDEYQFLEFISDYHTFFFFFFYNYGA